MIVTCPHCQKTFSTGKQTTMSAARALTGKSLQTVADEAGVSIWQMSRIERGLALQPRLDIARKIARAYNSTMDELWPLESESTSPSETDEEDDEDDIEEPEDHV